MSAVSGEPTWDGTYPNRVRCDEPRCWYCTNDSILTLPRPVRLAAMKRHITESETFAKRLEERIAASLADDEEADR